MKKALTAIVSFLVILVFLVVTVFAKSPHKIRSKFYDFSEQLIDGEIKKPTALYTNSRQAVKFDRLLKLKKSFLPKIFATAKDKVFK